MSKVQKFLANEGGIHKRRLDIRPTLSAIHAFFALYFIDLLSHI
jgi:hypothetical protein